MWFPMKENLVTEAGSFVFVRFFFSCAFLWKIVKYLRLDAAFWYIIYRSPEAVL